jgi:hypothetical protein
MIKMKKSVFNGRAAKKHNMKDDFGTSSSSHREPGNVSTFMIHLVL